MCTTETDDAENYLTSGMTEEATAKALISLGYRAELTEQHLLRIGENTDHLTDQGERTASALERIADALERLAPATGAKP
jgi:Holliday junction resolvasome RuvABC DNA-binding subunit